MGKSNSKIESAAECRGALGEVCVCVCVRAIRICTRAFTHTYKFPLVIHECAYTYPHTPPFPLPPPLSLSHTHAYRNTKGTEHKTQNIIELCICIQGGEDS